MAGGGGMYGQPPAIVRHDCCPVCCRNKLEKQSVRD
jgi:hypothetical protein